MQTSRKPLLEHIPFEYNMCKHMWEESLRNSLSRLVQYLMKVKIFTPSITIVLNELYTEFFKQVCKVELLNTKQGHKDKGFGLCI